MGKVCVTKIPPGRAGWDLFFLSGTAKVEGCEFDIETPLVANDHIFYHSDQVSKCTVCPDYGHSMRVEEHKASCEFIPVQKFHF